jgi:hypothetical protein
MGLMAYSITAVTHCTKVGRLSPMNISRIAVGAVIAILLSDNAIAGALGSKLNRRIEVASGL